jgi:hypothetical protein
MDRKTSHVCGVLLSALAAVGLTACNETGFSFNSFIKNEADSSGPNPNPSESPEPEPTNSPTPNPTSTPEPSPSATPTPEPTPSHTPPPNVQSKVDQFNAPERQQAKVDMLFCIDNSFSMDDKQAVLANSIDTFIGQFVARGVDFQIGIVSTDVSSTKSSYWSDMLPKYVQPNRGRLLSRTSERFLTSTSKNVVQDFKTNAKVGVAGSGREQCFASMLYALSDSNIKGGGFNERFVRDDAVLSMIIVSDEDEAVGSDPSFSGETVEGLIKRMRDRLSVVKGANSRGYSFDFVINTTVKKPSKPVSYPLSSGANYYPNFYYAAANAFVGKTYDVLKNFGSDLAKIGGEIIDHAEREYKLSAKAILGSVKVRVDGSSIAEDGSNGFIYHADKNTIELVGEALAASPGAQILIHYDYLVD